MHYLFYPALLLLVLSGISCAYRAPSYQFSFVRPAVDCVLSEHEIGRPDVWACPQRAVDVTAKTACDDSLWDHIYHPKRLVVHQKCISVTGTLVDASHGRNSDGCRHEADGDCHTWLRLDAGEESLLNAMNVKNEGGNLVIEPICR